MKRILLFLCCFCSAAIGMQAQRMIQASPHIRAFETERGFLLLSADDNSQQVLGYSDESSFAEARKNPAFRWMLGLMERNLLKMSDGRRRIPASMGPIYKPANVKDVVPPLTTDLWHQFCSPYFDQCPTIDGDTCVTGCVATALAQVMYYHRWPKRGQGSHTYEDTDGCGQTLTADFSAHSYDWEYMLDEYKGDYTKREGEAVALLMSDCGIAVNMKYGVKSSGAHSVYQAQALVNYFDYDPGVMMRYRNFYTQVEWDSIMFNELSEGRPMIVSAWDPGKGHSFICDGYDADGYFHVSFGNEDGYGNGYYYFTFLTPDMPEWHQFKDNPEGGFNLLQCLTTGVRPRTSVPSPEQHLYAFSHLTPMDNSTVVVHHLCNIGWNKHEGRVGLALMPGGQFVYQYSRDFLLEEVEDTTYTDTISIQLPPQLADGTYRLVPVYEDNGKLVEARSMVGVPNYLICSVERGVSSLKEPEDATFDLHVTDVSDFPDLFAHWTRPDYTITLRNDGSEYSGRFYVALYTDDAPQVNVIIAREGLSLGTGETAVRPFTETVFRNPPEGTYHLRILADIDLFSDSLVTIYDDPQREITVVKTLPTHIETAETSAPHDGSVFYDLSGRPISPHNSKAVRRPVIVVTDGKARKIMR